MDYQNLRPLRRSSEPAVNTTLAKLALVNTKSLATKTFILNDFLTTRNLDFLQVTETWLSLCEFSPFSELVPPDCYYLNSPRITGRGGELATVYKNCFNCCQLTADAYSSFELQLFEIRLSTPVQCVLRNIIRTPYKNFLNS